MSFEDILELASTRQPIVRIHLATSHAITAILLLRTAERIALNQYIKSDTLLALNNEGLARESWEMTLETA